MDSCSLFGTRLIAYDTNPPPTADNDNLQVAASWQTPAEALQTIRSWKEQIRQELAADARLWDCPKHRLTREITLAMEKCALWHYYGIG